MGEGLSLLHLALKACKKIGKWFVWVLSSSEIQDQMDLTETHEIEVPSLGRKDLAFIKWIFSSDSLQTVVNGSMETLATKKDPCFFRWLFSPDSLTNKKEKKQEQTQPGLIRWIFTPDHLETRVGNSPTSTGMIKWLFEKETL